MTTPLPSTPPATAASDDYTYGMQVDVPLPQILAALTDDAVISRWWTAATRSERHGDEVRLFAGGDASFVDFTVEHSPGTGEVAWAVTACVEPDWVGTRPSFSVRANDDGTHAVGFRHVGLRPALRLLRPVPSRLEPLHAQPAPVPRDRKRPAERAARHLGVMRTTPPYPPCVGFSVDARKNIAGQR